MSWLLEYLVYITCYSAAIVSCLASTMTAASDCDQFEESKLCVSHLTNLIDRLPTEDEVVCQELCQSHTRCSHFSFMEDIYPLETGEPDLQCYLWKRCISRVTLFQTLPITQLSVPGALLFDGLHLFSGRPHPPQHGGLLLLPVPVRCL